MSDNTKTLDEIKEAEIRATKTDSEAKQKAEQILVDARKNASEIIDNAHAAKAKLLETELKKAEAEVSKEKEKLRAQNNLEVSRIKNSASKSIGKEADFLVEKLKESVYAKN